MCGRCKELRYHTVSAIAPDGKIEQVVCNFCHASHRAAATVTKAAAKSATVRKPRAPRSSSDVDDGTQTARPYAPVDSYEKGAVIQHAKYGRGKVTDVRSDRIDVRFGDGSVRIFIHAMKR